MKWVLRTIALLIFLPGFIFTFQGIGLIKGSFMTGSTTWLIIGVIMMLAAIGAWVASNRMRTA